MAELGIVASALQIADIGIRLSIHLYTFGETVASADKSLLSISKDVSLTSTVLKELGQTLERDQTVRICSPNAVQTAESIAKECQRIFQEMDQVLVKKFANTKSTEKDRKIKAAQTLNRLRWPFIKGKIELLTSNLERQKSTLVLMLNVITLAKQEYERTEPTTTIAEQRSLIQDLARSNEEYIRKFEQLKLSCEGVPIRPEPILADYYNSMPTPKISTAQGFVNASALGPTSLREPSTDAQGLGPEPYMRSWCDDGSNISPPDHLSWLQQQYRNLMSTLLIEVSAPKYEIAADSRSRIKAEIVTVHIREMRYMEQIQYSRSASLARPMGMAWQIPKMHMQQPIHMQQLTHMQPQSPIQQQSFSSLGAVDFSASKFNKAQIGVPVLRDSYQSYAMQNCISQDATYNSPSAMAMSATSHTTRGEHEQNSTAQSRFSMLCGSQQTQSAMAAMAAAPQPLPVPRGTNSSGVINRMTIQHRGRRTSLSTPPPCIKSLPLSPASQPLPLPLHHALPNAAKAVDQESSIYGASAGQSDQRQPTSKTLNPQAAPLHLKIPMAENLKPIVYPMPTIGKRKIDSASLSLEFPVGAIVPNSENSSSSPPTFKFTRRHEEHTTVTKNAQTSEGGASDEMHVASSAQDIGATTAPEKYAVYSMGDSSRNVHRGRSLESISFEGIFHNHTPEDRAENIVDRLLATWTTFPVSVNRTASHQGGFAVIAH